MKAGRIVWSIVGLLSLTAAARAEPVLLASFDTTTNGGNAPEENPRIEFILQLPTIFPPTDFFGLGLGRQIFWDEHESGEAYYDASNDSAFESFALHATDGIEDQFIVWTRFSSGSGYGDFGTESELFSITPDLVGYTLDYVKLIVNDVRFEPWAPNQNQGFKFEADITYEFYGTVIPEPASLTLLAIGVVCAFRRRATRKTTTQ